MVKNDRWIAEMAGKGMIEPFSGAVKKSGCISFGASSYGYDMRVADEYRILKSKDTLVLDPKQMDQADFEVIKGPVFEIPAGSFVLARSLEYFRIPRDVVTICFGKSTYARCGVVVNVTPFEPEWEGFVTISICNTGNHPVRIYSNEGIAQVLFLGAAEVCETSYADRAGKYQAQKDITLSKI